MHADYLVTVLGDNGIEVAGAQYIEGKAVIRRYLCQSSGRYGKLEYKEPSYLCSLTMDGSWIIICNYYCEPT